MDNPCKEIMTLPHLLYPNVIIYGRPNCEWCTKATNFCIKNNIDYRYINVFRSDFDVVALVELTGMKTVPIIYVNGKLIGGYNAFVDWYQGEYE